MKKISIYIPSYKRPEVISKTLGGIVTTLPMESSDIFVHVGLNAPDSRVKDVIRSYEKNFSGIKIPFTYTEYKDNIGKAAVLNDLFNTFKNESNLVITLDNDMVFKKPWINLIQSVEDLDFDMMGFASATFWVHLPPKKSCKKVQDIKGYSLYSVPAIGGGMLLFHKKFLMDHPWTNLGGVYGRDDEQMYKIAKKKYVLEWEEDWLDHDPIGRSTPELIAYDDRKKGLYKKGKTVFPEGWDE